MALQCRSDPASVQRGTHWDDCMTAPADALRNVEPRDRDRRASRHWRDTHRQPADPVPSRVTQGLDERVHYPTLKLVKV